MNDSVELSGTDSIHPTSSEVTSRELSVAIDVGGSHEPTWQIQRSTGIQVLGLTIVGANPYSGRVDEQYNSVYEV